MVVTRSDAMQVCKEQIGWWNAHGWEDKQRQTCLLCLEEGEAMRIISGSWK
jgi:hypothetical protein